MRKPRFLSSGPSQRSARTLIAGLGLLAANPACDDKPFQPTVVDTETATVDVELHLPAVCQDNTLDPEATNPDQRPPEYCEDVEGIGVRVVPAHSDSFEDVPFNQHAYFNSQGVAEVTFSRVTPGVVEVDLEPEQFGEVALCPDLDPTHVTAGDNRLKIPLVECSPEQANGDGGSDSATGGATGTGGETEGDTDDTNGTITGGMDSGDSDGMTTGGEGVDCEDVYDNAEIQLQYNLFGVRPDGSGDVVLARDWYQSNGAPIPAECGTPVVQHEGPVEPQDMHLFIPDTNPLPQDHDYAQTVVGDLPQDQFSDSIEVRLGIVDEAGSEVIGESTNATVINAEVLERMTKEEIEAFQAMETRAAKLAFLKEHGLVA